MAAIQLRRSDLLLRYRRDSIFEGRRGVWRIGAREWPTVELVSRDGQRYVSLRAGLYVAAMALMATGRRALRFLAEGHTAESYGAEGTFRSLAAGRVYAHGAHVTVLRPDHLKGCIGIGMEIAPLGVSESMLAMSDVFSELGGFKEGERFEVEVS